MNKFKNPYVIASLIASLAIAYYFAYIPYQKQEATKYCHGWANNEVEERFNPINEIVRHEVYTAKFNACLNEQGF